MSKNWDFNEWVCSGNLTRDAELKYTPSGKPVLNFSIAVNGRPNESGDQKTSFFDCNLWGKGAEVLAPYLKKGKPVMLKGHPEQQVWKDNKDGKNRSRIVHVVERVKFQIGQKAVEHDGDPSGSSNHSGDNRPPLGGDETPPDWDDAPPDF